MFTQLFHFSSPVWFYYHIRGGLPPRPAIRPPQQLGGDQVRGEIRLKKKQLNDCPMPVSKVVPGNLCSSIFHPISFLHISLKTEQLSRSRQCLLISSNFVRLDAQKFVCETRRAVAERAENIGIWFKILEMLAKLAVISNVSGANNIIRCNWPSIQ